MKICVICKSSFKPTVHNKAMCSDACVKKYRNNWMKKDYKSKRELSPPKEKKCGVCGVIFLIAQDKGRPKTCSLACRKILYDRRIRNWNLEKKYGLSSTAYNDLLVQQKGKCAICEKDHKECRNGLYVDHDHASNQTRQLLCKECNLGLGFFNDTLTILEKAITYLKKHKEK